VPFRFRWFFRKAKAGLSCQQKCSHDDNLLHEKYCWNRHIYSRGCQTEYGLNQKNKKWQANRCTHGDGYPVEQRLLLAVACSVFKGLSHLIPIVEIDHILDNLNHLIDGSRNCDYLESVVYLDIIKVQATVTVRQDRFFVVPCSDVIGYD